MAESTAVDASEDASLTSTEKKTATVDPTACAADAVGDNASENVDSNPGAKACSYAPASADANPFKMPIISQRPGQKKSTLGVLAKAFTDKTENTKTIKTPDKHKTETDEGEVPDKADSTSEVKSTTAETSQQSDSDTVAVNLPDTRNDNHTEKPPTNMHNKLKYLSPAERLKHAQIPINYKEPAWGSISDRQYHFEVLKSGSIVDTIDLQTKSFHVFGRLPTCDVTLEHPSLSRYHAVLQFCGTASKSFEVGWYLYDLDSTHGTWVNKVKVKSRIYQRIRVGHVVKFGGSTRLFILQVHGNILNIRCTKSDLFVL